MRGAISAEKISAGSHRLRLEGPPIAVNEKNKTNAAIVPLGKPVKVEIRLTHALRSIEEAREILNRVFFLDDQVPQYSLPEYQRHGPFPGKIYRVKEPGLTPPKAVFAPDPDYAEKAQRTKLEGDVVLGIVIDEGGTVAKISLESSSGMELDRAAVERVKQWRFIPGSKDGHPVAVQTSVGISFNLYNSQ
jgi:protein TonB